MSRLRLPWPFRLHLVLSLALLACSDETTGTNTGGPAEDAGPGDAPSDAPSDSGPGDTAEGDTGEDGGGDDTDDTGDTAIPVEDAESDESGSDAIGEDLASGDAAGEDSSSADAIGEDLVNTDSGDGGDAADGDVAIPPRVFCELSRHSLAQLSDNRCITFPADFVLRSGESIVVGTDATPAEFAACYPEFPELVDTEDLGGGAFFENRAAGVYYLDSSAPVFAITGGLPNIDGGEHYSLRQGACTGGLGFGGSGAGAVGEGTRIEVTTIDVPGDAFYHLERRIPVVNAGSPTSWLVEEGGGELTAGMANPGYFFSTVHDDLVISEISHADTAGCSFVEITCPFPEPAPPPDPACCDFELDMCVEVDSAAECDGIYYPSGGCIEPCGDPPPPPPEPACCFFEGDACASVTGPNECERGQGIFYADGTTCIEPCEDPPPPLDECCDFELDACVEVGPAEACNGTRYPAGGTACTEPCPRTTPSGACCRFETEDCLDDVLPSYCNGIGTFHAGLSCAEIDCVGSCCGGDGTCGESSRDDCSQDGGVWLGLGSACEPDPCRGACCDADGSCAARTEEACSLRHGEYLGANVACQEDLCSGACCNEITGECREVVENACVSDRDLWHGAGSSCDAVDCDPVAGACCDANGGCEQEIQSVCVSGEGEWLGARAACDPGTCDGACCNQVTGTCSETVESSCTGDGFLWHGAGTSCAEVGPCSNTLGACCEQNGACALSASAACDGTYFGSDFCDPGFCLGACCDRIAGECSTGVAEGACAPEQYAWAGRGSTCGDLDCFPDADLDDIEDDEDNCALTANFGQANLDADDLGNVCDPTPFACTVAPGGDAVAGLSSLDATQTCAELVSQATNAAHQSCQTTCGYGLRQITNFNDDDGNLANAFECCNVAVLVFPCTGCPGPAPECPDPDIVCPANNPFD